MIIESTSVIAFRILWYAGQKCYQWTKENKWNWFKEKYCCYERVKITSNHQEVGEEFRRLAIRLMPSTIHKRTQHNNITFNHFSSIDNLIPCDDDLLASVLFFATFSCIYTIFPQLKLVFKITIPITTLINRWLSSLLCRKYYLKSLVIKVPTAKNAACALWSTCAKHSHLFYHRLIFRVSLNFIE